MWCFMSGFMFFLPAWSWEWNPGTPVILRQVLCYWVTALALYLAFYLVYNVFRVHSYYSVNQSFIYSFHIITESYSIVWINHILSVHLSAEDHRGCLYLWLLWMVLWMWVYYEFLCGCIFGEITGPMVLLYVTLWGSHTACQRAATLDGSSACASLAQWILP